MTEYLDKAEAALLRDVADSCLCFKARKAAREITRFYDRHFGKAQIEPTQFNILAAIRLSQPVPLTHLAEILGLERTTFTRNLVLLEKAGFTESRSGRDSRTRLISLTSAGNRVLKQALLPWKHAQTKAMSVLGPKNFSRLSEALSLSSKLNRS